jgi:hypothetical protein
MISNLKKIWHTTTRGGESIKGQDAQGQVTELDGRETKAKEHEFHRLAHELQIAHDKDTLRDEDASLLLKAESALAMPLHKVAAEYHHLTGIIDEKLSHGPEAPKSVKTKLLRYDVDKAEQEWLAAEKHAIIRDPNTTRVHKAAAAIRYREHQAAAARAAMLKEKEERELLAKEVISPKSGLTAAAEEDLQRATEAMERAEAADYIVRDPDVTLPVRTVVPPPPKLEDVKAEKHRQEKERMKLDESGKTAEGAKPPKKPWQKAWRRFRLKQRVAELEAEQPQRKDRATLEREALLEEAPRYADAEILEHQLLRAQHAMKAQARTDVAMDKQAPVKARVGGLINAVEHKAVADVHLQAALERAEQEAIEANKRWKEAEEKLEQIRAKTLEEYEREDILRQARARVLLQGIREAQVAKTQHELAARKAHKSTWDEMLPVTTRLWAAFSRTWHDMAAAYYATAKDVNVRAIELEVLEQDLEELAQGGSDLNDLAAAILAAPKPTPQPATTAAATQPAIEPIMAVEEPLVVAPAPDAAEWVAVSTEVAPVVVASTPVLPASEATTVEDKSAPSVLWMEPIPRVTAPTEAAMG